MTTKRPKKESTIPNTRSFEGMIPQPRASIEIVIDGVIAKIIDTFVAELYYIDHKKLAQATVIPKNPISAKRYKSCLLGVGLWRKERLANGNNINKPNSPRSAAKATGGISPAMRRAATTFPPKRKDDNKRTRYPPNLRSLVWIFGCSIITNPHSKLALQIIINYNRSISNNPLQYSFNINTEYNILC